MHGTNHDRPFLRWWLVIIGIMQMILTFIIILTEIGNILADFWITNIFAGLWTGPFVFATALSICFSGIAPKYALWLNTISLVPLSVLIGFDTVFLMNPYMCLLTLSACTSQKPLTSLQFMNNLPAFSSYTSYDSKKLFLLIQISCGGLSFVLCFIYVVSYTVIGIQQKKTRIMGEKIDRDNNIKVSNQDCSPKQQDNETTASAESFNELETSRPYPELPRDIPPWSLSNPTAGPSLFSPPY